MFRFSYAIEGLMLPDKGEVATPDEAEWFEYPTSWEQAYVAERGHRRYFAQYALMELCGNATGFNR